MCTLQMRVPNGQESTVYMMEVKGTLERITRRSPRARLKMYVFGTFRIVLCRMKMSTRVPFPRQPTWKEI